MADILTQLEQEFLLEDIRAELEDLEGEVIRRDGVMPDGTRDRLRILRDQVPPGHKLLAKIEVFLT